MIIVVENIIHYKWAESLKYQLESTSDKHQMDKGGCEERHP